MKSKNHLKNVASKPCMICGSREVQAHHLLRASPRGMAKKTGDEWAVPLCFIHHEALHLNGDEIEFFEIHGWEYEQVKNLAKELWIFSNAKQRTVF